MNIDINVIKSMKQMHSHRIRVLCGVNKYVIVYFSIFSDRIIQSRVISKNVHNTSKVTFWSETFKNI